MSGSNCSTCSSRGTCDIKDDDSSCSTGTCSGGVRLPPGITSVYDLDKDVERGTMVWAEVEGEGDEARVSVASLEAISQAASLGDERVFAVMMGPANHRRLADPMFEFGADTVYHVRGQGVESFQALSYAQSISEIIDRVKPAAFLCAATPRGRELAPCLAAKRGCGLTADCTGLRVDGPGLQMIRPAFGGNVLANVVCHTLPQMATLRPGAFPLPDPQTGRKGTVMTWTYRPQPSASRILSVLKEPSSYDEGSEALVSLGAGMCSEDDIKTAETLASLLGGSVSCSRAVVEQGFMTADRQVGQSGRVVRPRVYLAFGISGALQHRVGMSDSQFIIAVNSDAEAPIHAMADISVVADGRLVMQAMIDRLKKR